ncbi:helix-turn-helix domain-containing protein [Tenacibaculum maritimum]|nr:helix-turn-helix domain-containing protein [Tenacibaculum maritimum]MDB0600640.1 helix-turn-helix domain-containing protein [Tenacibaculum maritimum]MDB0612623.1 helix-turn-helix domain-containing protein [Tenacibaculum maritimum]
MLIIKELRKSLGYTQEQVALATGMSKRSYVSYENLSSDIPLKKLQDIASFFNVHVSELISETKNAVPKDVLEHKRLINKKKLSSDDILFVINSLYKHYDQLKEIEMFKVWELDIRADEKRKVLKEVIRKRLASED